MRRPLVAIFAVSALAHLALCIRFGAILRSGEDEHLGLALKLSAHWVGDELIPPARFHPKLEPPLVVYLTEGQRDAWSVLKAACELAAQGVAALFGPPDSSLEALIAPVAEQLHLPLFCAQREGPGGGYFHLALFSSRRYLEAVTDVLRFWSWGDFVYVYSRQTQLDSFAALFDGSLDGSWQDRERNIRLLHVDEANFLTSAYRFSDLTRQCIGEECRGLRKVLIDLPPDQLHSFLHQLLKLGLINNHFWYFVTTLDLPQTDLEEFRHNFVRISGLQPRLNTSRGFDSLWSKLVEPVMRYRNYTQSQQDYFPLSEILMQFDGVLLFTKAYLKLAKRERVNLERLRFGAKCYFPFPDADYAEEAVVGRLNAKPPKPYAFGLDLMVGIANADGRGALGPLAMSRSRQGSGRVRQNMDFTLWELDRQDRRLHQMANWTALNRAVEVNGTRKSRVSNQFERMKPHLIVSTILERPYMRLDNSSQGGIAHFSGFCADLLERLAHDLGFTYEFRVVKDGAYGSQSSITGEWNGMIGEVVRGEADIAVAPLTITYSRSEVVDFSAPFLQHGIAMLLRRPKETGVPNVTAFLYPIEPSLWFSIVAAIAIVIVCMFFIAQLTPYEGRMMEWPTETEEEEAVLPTETPGALHHVPNGHLAPHLAREPSRESERPPIAVPEPQPNGPKVFNFMNTTWYLMCILFRAGCEFSPKATSTRLLSGIFWVFSLVLISTYTAKFAAVLTVDRSTLAIRSFDDLVNQTEFVYGALANGSTAGFLRESRIPTFRHMWSGMALESTKGPSVFVSNNVEGVRRVVNGKYIYLMESTSLEYEVLQNCNLTHISQMVMGSKGYGIAFRKGSLWRDKMSARILSYADGGFLGHAKNMWWRSESLNCKRGGSSVKEERQALVLGQVSGPFLFLTLGLVLSLFVALAEFLVRRWRLSKVSVGTAAQPPASVMSDLMRQLAQIPAKRRRSEEIRRHSVFHHQATLAVTPQSHHAPLTSRSSYALSSRGHSLDDRHSLHSPHSPTEPKALPALRDAEPRPLTPVREAGDEEAGEERRKKRPVLRRVHLTAQIPPPPSQLRAAPSRAKSEAGDNGVTWSQL